MPRPQCCRRIAALPTCRVFKPAGVPRRMLREVSLAVDEFEALRLADHEGLYQEEAARRMAVSRQTFGRIVESARRKVARALVEGCALRIEGGTIEMAETRKFECAECGHAWELPFGTGRPAGCPACQGKALHRAKEAAAGPGGGRGGRCCRHRGGGRGGRGLAGQDVAAQGRAGRGRGGRGMGCRGGQSESKSQINQNKESIQ
jgi:uncharacterized protein